MLCERSSYEHLLCRMVLEAKCYVIDFIRKNRRQRENRTATDQHGCKRIRNSGVAFGGTGTREDTTGYRFTSNSSWRYLTVRQR
jgi:hypothetical protein